MLTGKDTQGGGIDAVDGPVIRGYLFPNFQRPFPAVPGDALEARRQSGLSVILALQDFDLMSINIAPLGYDSIRTSSQTFMPPCVGTFEASTPPSNGTPQQIASLRRTAIAECKRLVFEGQRVMLII